MKKKLVEVGEWYVINGRWELPMYADGLRVVTVCGPSADSPMPTSRSGETRFAHRIARLRRGEL